MGGGYGGERRLSGAVICPHDLSSSSSNHTQRSSGSSSFVNVENDDGCLSCGMGRCVKRRTAVSLSPC